MTAPGQAVPVGKLEQLAERYAWEHFDQTGTTMYRHAAKLGYLAGAKAALEMAATVAERRAYDWHIDKGSVPGSEAKAWAHDEAVRIHDAIRALIPKEKS